MFNLDKTAAHLTGRTARVALAAAGMALMASLMPSPASAQNLVLKDTFGGANKLEDRSGWTTYNANVVAFSVRWADGSTVRYMALCDRPGVNAEVYPNGHRGEYFRSQSTSIIWAFSERACGQS
ncbi:MAG: hypothetical protein RL260_3890 [Pseudomonadota bacterium]|jgi:hypothetical protein